MPLVLPQIRSASGPAKEDPALGRWHHIEDADERQLGRAAPQEDGLRYRELLMALWQLPALGPGSSGSS